MTPQTAAALFAAVFAGVVIFAAAYKYWELRIAGRWPAAPGRIVTSRVSSRPVKRVGGEGLETRNFADVTYEFEVRGAKRRGNRVSMGEDPGNFEIEETLARYPEGAGVLVYYDPGDPSQSVLERDASPGVVRTLVLFVLAGIGFVAALIFGPDQVVQWVRGVIPVPGNSGLAVFFAATGFFIAALAMALTFQAKATQNWRSTWGRIENSGIESFRPRVHYSYLIGDHRYQGDRIAFGGAASMPVDFFARRRAAKYPEGYPVLVFYDPANPASSVLERRSAGLGWIWAAAAVMFAVAARTAGYF